MIPKKFLLMLAFPLTWTLCSNPETPELQAHHEQSRILYTKNLLKKGIEALRVGDQPLRSACPEQVAREPMFDAWGRMIRCSFDHHSVSLISAGPDREFNSADDIELDRDLRLATSDAPSGH